MSKGLRINLLPSDIAKKRKAEKGLLFLIVAVFMFVGFLVAVSFLFGIKVQQEEAALSKLEAETTKIDKQIAKYSIYKDRKQTIEKHEQAIKSALDKQVFWHRLFNELSMIAPQNVSISKLTLTNEQISISAYGFNHQDVAEFLVRIMDLDELTDVWIDGSKDASLEKVDVVGEESDSSSSDDSGIVGVEFTLTAKLKNPGPDLESSGQAQSGSGSSSTSSEKSSGSK